MKISYRWLLNYLPVEESPEKIGDILTSIGLEVEGIHAVAGDAEKLKGLVVGEVLEVWQHPGADRLRLTKVNVGDPGNEPLQIVCGAPNVAQGQKVVVATVGATLYPVDAEPFKISKSKIRGEVSMGMLCAEDEIGTGKSHDGIIVLPEHWAPGTPYSNLLGAEQDYTLEIGLTPNRADAFSHIGVARDLAAAIKNMAGLDINRSASLQWPDISAFVEGNSDAGFQVEVADKEACPRYCGLLIEGITVAPSPEWLQQRLKAIGLNPINNVVDITNFVQHELGQPLHAFDAAAIKGKKIVVRSVESDTPFVTLDGIERKLHAHDLMICNAEESMCIAGVFGGMHSGVNPNTKAIFLESAFFNAVSVRKTARRHGLNTDASFRFERGVDPNITLLGLKRAALLICEITGAKVVSTVFDSNPQGSPHWEVNFNLKRCRSLLGLEIPVEAIESILADLDIRIKERQQEQWLLEIPPYRVDVKREADVAEEILRIYGFHNIPVPSKLNASLSYAPSPDIEQLRNRISDMLVSRGFVEMISNSLGKSSYAELLDASEAYAGENVPILNPLSQDLGMMRQSLVFGGLEAIIRNINFKQFDLRLFEFGKIYGKTNSGYAEHAHLALFVSGSQNEENWNVSQKKSSFSQLFGEVDQIIKKFRINGRPQLEPSSSKLFADGLRISSKGKVLADLGKLKSSLLKNFDIKQDVWYADVFWENLINQLPEGNIQYLEPEKFPVVRRDLSLVLEQNVNYSALVESAFRSEKKLLKEVGLFDVYEGEKLGVGKKSYALSFLLNDPDKTLTDDRIEQSMSRILQAFQKDFGAELRS
jgi:phenylalanyl-tRNA synthetase beta chain